MFNLRRISVAALGLATVVSGSSPAHAATVGRRAVVRDVVPLGYGPTGDPYQLVLTGSARETPLSDGSSEIAAQCSAGQPIAAGVFWTEVKCELRDRTNGARYSFRESVPPWISTFAEAHGSATVPTAHRYSLCVSGAINSWTTAASCTELQ
jgi:hypothetical protein